MLSRSNRLPLLCLPLFALWIGAEAQGVEVAQPSPPPVEAPPFDVWEYRVAGNTVLDNLIVERAIYGFLGRGKTITDVNAARAALEKAYRDAGYPTVFVDVPEQEVDGGLVRLTVTEGRISRLKITGARYFSNGWIRDQLPEARPDTVPRIDAFQAQLRALNLRSADRQLTPVLRPGGGQGTVEVELKVEDRLPVNGSLAFNNRSSVNTSDSRVEAAVRYDNLWQRDHSFGFQYQVAPEDRDETEVFVASYVLRPMATDRVFAFYGLKSDSNVATLGGDINSLGEGTVFGTRAIIPVRTSTSLIQSLQFGVDYKDFDETIGFNEEGQEDIVTPIAYLNWSAGWNATLPRETRTHRYDLTLNFGIRGVANEAQEFADKRFKARPDYFYLDAGYELVQALPWRTALALGLHAQLAPQPLISNEQFAAGGIESVRGYFEGEQLGDSGVQVSLELRSPDAGQRLWKRLGTFYGFGFVEGARLLLNDPLPSQEEDITLLSAGLGVRLEVDPLVAGLDLAWPLKDTSSTDAGDERLLFSVRYGF